MLNESSTQEARGLHRTMIILSRIIIACLLLVFCISTSKIKSNISMTNDMLLATILCILVALCNHADALIPSRISRRTSMRVRTVLQGWPGDNNFFLGGQDNEDKKSLVSSIITPQMEEEVMASARASMDTKAVSRAVSSLIDDDRIENSSKNKSP